MTRAPGSSSSPTAPSAGPLPRAVLKAKRRVSAAWLVPLGALILAVWLGYRTWIERGLPITVQLEEGYGLKTEIIRQAHEQGYSLVISADSGRGCVRKKLPFSCSFSVCPTQ